MTDILNLELGAEESREFREATVEILFLGLIG
jgi:hypothetical protein